jgi:hypothetical protein
VTYEHYDGARSQYDLPEPGSLIAFHHKVWRVIEIRRTAESEWTDDERNRLSTYKDEYRARFAPIIVVIRPAEVTSTDVRARDHDKHWRIDGRHYGWHVYRDEHYPTCVHCNEPTPCREVLGKREAEKAVAVMSRYEDPNVCPACQEPFTRRQKTHSFPENVELPGGPPVTFHMRGKCWGDAMMYEKKIVKLNPDWTPELHCPGGVITNHNDGTYQCSAGDRCPGPATYHDGYQTCRCEPCHAVGRFGCMPLAWATRRAA